MGLVPFMATLDRLRELVREPGSRGISSVGSVPGGRYGADTDPEWLAHVLGGSFEPSAGGSCLVVRRTYAGETRYGNRRIREYPPPGQDLLGVLVGLSTGSSMAAARDAIICLDLETTGLCQERW